MDPLVTTTRLALRDWSDDDAAAALAIYGSGDVARWLTPAMDRIADVETMRSVLGTWRQQQPELIPPQGRWAIHRTSDDAVIGGVAIGLLPPNGEDLEVSWQLNPAEWGKGYAAEAARALIAWAFTQEIDELFAVARPSNVRATAMAKRLGMQWVGETAKYYGLNLQVYRIRPSDL
jgi:RimJ/RimL family protein N-acetyltransferase